MRTNSFLRKSQLLLKQSSVTSPVQPFSTPRSPRFKSFRPTSSSLSTNRHQSTGVIPPNGPEDPPSTISSVENVEVVNSNVHEPEVNSEDPDKLVLKPRRTRIVAPPPNSKDSETVELPLTLEDDVLYAPIESQVDSHYALPPPEMFNEALNNLMITLHPQNQRRAMLAAGPSDRLIEPTLGLYCPIEGGDYVIDLTVQELAFQTGAEVLVLDSVQLAAGEWGVFGKGASALHLPNNPLHFSSPPTSTFQSRPGKQTEEKEEDFDDEDRSQVMFAAPRISLALPKGLTSTLSRGLLAPSPRKTPSPTKLESFFEALVNLPSPATKAAESSSDGKSRPRLIYVRDFPTLAPSSSVWYPPLLAAVRQRRRRILSRTSNAASSPVTIVFGMTPPVTHPSGSLSGSSSSNLMNLLTNRNASASQMALGAKEHTHDWGENEAAEVAREKRLRSRLRKWERNAHSLHDEFPTLSTAAEGENSSKSNIIFLGGPDSQMNMPPMFNFDDSDSPTEPNSQFFRASVIVPRSRVVAKERESRVARRREINELTMRMGIGAIGGVIEPNPASLLFTSPDPGSDATKRTASDASTSKPSSDSIWEDWGNKVETWSDVSKISDRAMGSVLASTNSSHGHVKNTIESTVVPWSAIEKAWKSSHAMAEARKNWLKETIGAQPVADETSGEKEKLLNAGSESDKVVETIKNDPELDQHEGRLLPCIVDSLSITTTFNQVHLPSHTIDSIRTIVSLPLLHPHAFKEGILKEHSMTGCLLFGPPGTGKTLAVRALAKEAGCRMLAISPSDVMDMYVGEGEKLVRAVFSLARRLSPCVVFLDEIDALFGARMSARDSGSAFAHRGIITEFMQEMDGLKSSKDDNVIVIGATNRPFDLDDAVLRRLPRRLLVDLPGEKERKEILKILLRDENLAQDLSIEALSKKTDGFSGSDLKHLCVSAALDSVKEHMELPWLSRHSTGITSATSPSLDPESTIPPKDTSQETLEPVEVTQPAAPTAETVQLLKEGISSEAAETQPAAPTGETQLLKEGISSEAAETPEPLKDQEKPPTPEKSRTLHLRNFTQALKEITPSSSESLGSLADLRKWNEEFGEGRRDQKKRQVWGKGRFGFVNSNRDQVGDGRVAKE